MALVLNWKISRIWTINIFNRWVWCSKKIYRVNKIPLSISLWSGTVITNWIGFRAVCVTKKVVIDPFDHFYQIYHFSYNLSYHFKGVTFKIFKNKPISSDISFSSREKKNNTIHPTIKNGGQIKLTGSI